MLGDGADLDAFEAVLAVRPDFLLSSGLLKLSAWQTEPSSATARLSGLSRSWVSTRVVADA